MQALLSYVQAVNGRLIASGDTRQHGAVEASDALRAIEKYSGLRPAELHEIRRQDPRRANNRSEREFIEEYRRAVKEAAAGDIRGAFDRLSANGALLECTLADQHAQLAEHYLDLASRGETTVVVSQTWSEIQKVNEVVRARLKEQNLIGGDERIVVSLERLDLTDAQKRERRFYGPGTILVFNQNCGAVRKGESAQLVAITDKGLIVESARKVSTVALRQLNRVTICRKRDMTLAAGDRLQLKANAQMHDGQRVANGELVTVERIEPDGRIALKDGRTLESDYRQFVRGYAVTSYASQGKTVDYVLFSDSAVRAATNRQQWYVTISRGRKGIRIFTSDPHQRMWRARAIGSLRSICIGAASGSGSGSGGASCGVSCAGASSRSTCGGDSKQSPSGELNPSNNAKQWHHEKAEASEFREFRGCGSSNGAQLRRLGKQSAGASLARRFAKRCFLRPAIQPLRLRALSTRGRQRNSSRHFQLPRGSRERPQLARTRTRAPKTRCRLDQGGASTLRRPRRTGLHVYRANRNRRDQRRRCVT